VWRLGEKYTNQNNILGIRYLEAIKWADSGKWLKDRIVDFLKLIPIVRKSATQFVSVKPVLDFSISTIAD
jgi:hypothetical protein